MHQFQHRLISLVVFAACGVAPSVARAETPAALSVDVAKVIDSTYAWFQGRETTVQPLRAPLLIDKPALAPSPSLEQPVLNPPLRLSLVARDWGGAFNLAGGKMVSDEVRLSRSSRMVVGRARIDLGKFQPYVHAALGEWRYDPTILPLLPRNQEYATQFAVGFEYRVAKHARLAVEGDYTILCRETREPQNNPTPRVLGAYGVLHTKF